MPLCHSCTLEYALLVVAVTVAALAAAHESRAAIFTVDRFDDDAAAMACLDSTPNDCSLRGAIRAANALAGADIVNVPAGSYTLTLEGTGENAAAVGDLDITDDLTLTGAGAATTIIRGVAGDRVFHVDPNGALIDVMISGVTIQNGAAVVVSFASAAGAGILLGTHQTLGSPTPSGKLTVVDSVVRSNTTVGNGGGIAVNAGTLTLLRTTVANNSSNGHGGGIFVGDSGKLMVHASTVRNNAGSNGGGIYVGEFDTSIGNTVVVVTSSTLNGNAANGSGGGIARNRGTLQVSNSTISGNTAGDGGGIVSSPYDGTNTIRNSTIADNRSGSFVNFGLNGAGIANAGPLTLRNTLVANNTNFTGAVDCVGPITSAGYNLIRSPGGNCSVTGNTTGDLIGQDPVLGSLGSNGGATQTHALLPGSPAIGGGNPALPGSGIDSCETTDQRGLARPNPAGGRCDIGAVEMATGLALTAITPDHGGNSGSAVTVVRGNGFRDGAAIKLVRSGQPDIAGNATTLAIADGGTAAAVSFDLTGSVAGLRDLVLANPDGTSARLANAFQIETAQAPQLWADVVARPVMRVGRPTTIKILYGNHGNVDALGVPLMFSFPGNFRGIRLFAISKPPAQPGQRTVDWDKVPIEFLTADDAFANVPLVLPIVPAGYTGVLDILLVAPLELDTQFEFRADISPPYFGSGLNPDVIASNVREARKYALNVLGVSLPATLDPLLVQYATAQLQQVVANGRASLMERLGTENQVYSLARLVIDLALFGTTQVP